MTLGIDLGTTYSAAAYVDEDGEAHVITNREGKKTTPSVFYEESVGNIIVGEIAKEHAYIRPDDVVDVVKNYMGTKEVFTTSSGTTYSPEDISAYIIRKMVQDAESYIGKGKITDVVITIPAYFDDSQRKATEDAARIAGVHMMASINEPTAAMLSYAHKNDITSGHFMIYDLGGGTFDVSIVQVEGEKITVLSTDGARRTGGFFFDEMIVKMVTDKLFEKHGLDLEKPEYKEDLNELYRKAENCKMQLSSAQSAMISIRVGDVKESITITREMFESKINRLYRNTEAKMKNAIRNAGITAEQIDAVLMVGGSSRIPMIEDKVKMVECEVDTLSELVLPEGLESIVIDELQAPDMLTIPSTVRSLKMIGANMYVLTLKEGVQTAEIRAVGNLVELNLPSSMQTFVISWAEYLEELTIPEGVISCSISGCEFLPDR